MADIDEIRKKIDKLITEKGLNYRDVSLKIGRKESYIHQYIKYRYPRRLKEIDRVRLAKLLDVDDTEIMDDEVIASKTGNAPSAKLDIISDIIKTSNSPEGKLISIDVLDAHMPANDPHFLAQAIGHHLVCKAMLDDLTASKPEDLKIIKILNESMSPTISSGDLLWFDKSYQYPEADGLYLIASGRELIARRIQISPLDGTITLTSDNPAYQAYTAPSNKEVKVLGKIVCVTHKL